MQLCVIQSHTFFIIIFFNSQNSKLDCSICKTFSSLGFPDPLLSWFFSYLSGHRFSVIFSVLSFLIKWLEFLKIPFSAHVLCFSQLVSFMSMELVLIYSLMTLTFIFLARLFSEMRSHMYIHLLCITGCPRHRCTSNETEVILFPHQVLSFPRVF